MTGMLYLCATPIGNLGDMTPRVVETLREVDLIAAEDTRNSIKLLNHFEIKTSMTSYHEYNKVEKADYLVAQMQQGKNVALVTDAGTPGDLGSGKWQWLKCHEAGSGDFSSGSGGLASRRSKLSGLSTRRFCFSSFSAGGQEGESGEILEELKEESRTIILYEAPHIWVRTLGNWQSVGKLAADAWPGINEKFETVLPTTIEGAL